MSSCPSMPKASPSLLPHVLVNLNLFVYLVVLDAGSSLRYILNDQPAYTIFLLKSFLLILRVLRVVR